jgi:hypothetical protein
MPGFLGFRTAIALKGGAECSTARGRERQRAWQRDVRGPSAHGQPPGALSMGMSSSRPMPNRRE